MEVISYLNISVDGIAFTKILEFSTSHQLNEHATAHLMGEIERDAGEDFVKRVDETTAVTIRTTAEGQPPILFCGSVADVGLDQEQEYARLELNLKSTSCMLDLQKNNKSFQDTGKTYEDILNQIYKGKAKLTMEVSDRPIGNLIMQYQETNWEFTKRMASVFNAPVVANLNTKIPQLTIGIPKSEKVYNLESVEHNYGAAGVKSLTQPTASAGATKQDDAGSGIRTNQYLFVGDTVVLNGKTEKVKSVSSKMEKGIIVTTIQAAKEGNITQPATTNVQASGKMFTGIVQAVEKDKVQAHLIDIDDSYDGGGTHWFPYSTAYSSGDGSGFYCMPEVGDQVRVFFPSNSEGEAFAASSVCVSPLDNPKHKQWRTPGGKRILMTEEGMVISCVEGEIFIDLSDENGITIKSTKDINICSTTNMLLMARNNIMLQADNNVLISTAESYIEVRKDGIELGSENVVIN